MAICLILGLVTRKWGDYFRMMAVKMGFTLQHCGSKRTIGTLYGNYMQWEHGIFDRNPGIMSWIKLTESAVCVLGKSAINQQAMWKS